MYFSIKKQEEASMKLEIKEQMLAELKEKSDGMGTRNNSEGSDGSDSLE
jgi:hypothetical protein